MLENYIIWNGISSEDFDHLMIKKVPSLDRPKRKMEVFSVPGRNGDIVLSQDAYEDYEVEYKLFLYADEKGSELAERCAEIAEWLYEPVGYTQFQDSYDPEYIRYAYISDEVEIKNKLAKYGTVEIPFTFRPERYLTVGQFETEYTLPPVTIGNPTKFPSKPLIHIYPNTSVVLTNATLTINDCVISISSLTEDMYIDCESMNAYKDDTNKNPLISLSTNDFPRLEAGQNTITWSSRIEKISIVPRWWTI